MNKKEYREDLFNIARTWLFIMVFFFLINLLVGSYLIENRGFLFWFNTTCFMGTILFITWLDYYKYKIIEGRLREKKVVGK